MMNNAGCLPAGNGNMSKFFLSEKGQKFPIIEVLVRKIIFGSPYHLRRSRNAPKMFGSTAGPPLSTTTTDRGSTPATTDLSLAPVICFHYSVCNFAVRFSFSIGTANFVFALNMLLFADWLLFLPAICFYYSERDCPLGPILNRNYRWIYVFHQQNASNTAFPTAIRPLFLTAFTDQLPLSFVTINQLFFLQQ